jgi:hypothetical protein
MKETATEWFFNELQRMQYFIGNDMLEAYKQAMEIEKQDIISAYAFGHNDGCRYMTNEKQEFEHGEGYYQETFKSE